MAFSSFPVQLQRPDGTIVSREDPDVTEWKRRMEEEERKWEEKEKNWEEERRKAYDVLLSTHRDQG